MAAIDRDKLQNFVMDYLDNKDAFETDDEARIATWRQHYPTSKKTNAEVLADVKRKLEHPFGKEILKIEDEDLEIDEATLDRTREELAAIAYSNILQILEPDPRHGLVLKPSAWRRITKGLVAGVAEIQQVGEPPRWKIKMTPKNDALKALARMDGAFDKDAFLVKQTKTEKTHGSVLAEITTLLKQDEDTREAFISALQNDRQLWSHFAARVTEGSGKTNGRKPAS